MLRFITILFSIPFIIVVAAFAYRNAQAVKIDFFVNTYFWPLAIIILLALIVGGIMGFMVNFYIIIKQKNKIRQLKKQNKEMLGLSSILDEKH